MWWRPAFWIAFFVTLTETVGAGCVALPIAFARVPVTTTVVLLILFGIVNMVTVAALVEAITRNAAMSRGDSYFAGMVGDYLGALGRRILSPALTMLNVAGLVATMLGFGSTLAAASGVPAIAWTTVLIGVNVVALSRRSFDITANIAIAVGVANVVLLVSMSILALRHPTGPTPPVPTSTTALGPVFGIALTVYFGHLSAGNSAKVVLRRDPTGESLLWGNLAAMVAAMALYVLWTVSTRVAVPAVELADHAGTALTPLARRVGPVVGLLGSSFAVLALGLGSIYCSLSLQNQARDTGRLTARSRPVRFCSENAASIAVFAAVTVFAVRGGGAFTAPLSIVGSLSLPLLGGLFPMLMLHAARVRGDRTPGRTLRVIGRRSVAAATLALHTCGTLSLAIWIWDDRLSRLAAVVVAAGIPAVTIASWRRGAFTTSARVVVRRPGRRVAQRVHLRLARPRVSLYRVAATALAAAAIATMTNRMMIDASARHATGAVTSAAAASSPAVDRAPGNGSRPTRPAAAPVPASSSPGVSAEAAPPSPDVATPSASDTPSTESSGSAPTATLLPPTTSSETGAAGPTERTPVTSAPPPPTVASSTSSSAPTSTAVPAAPTSAPPETTQPSQPPPPGSADTSPTSTAVPETTAPPFGGSAPPDTATTSTTVTPTSTDPLPTSTTAPEHPTPETTSPSPGTTLPPPTASTDLPTAPSTHR